MINYYKKLIGVVLCSTLIFFLVACEKQQESESTQSKTPETSESLKSDNEKIKIEDSRILIAYFSRIGNSDTPNETEAVSSASVNIRNNVIEGNTEIVAKMIQSKTGGDISLIEMENKYPSDYSVIENQGRDERNDNIRPALLNNRSDIDSYDIIFLGYPNWWGDMPMAVYSFLEEYDFSNKIIIPFCTSGGSGFSNSIENIRKEQPQATIKDGLAISQTLPDGTEDEINTWLSNLGLTK